MSLSQIIVSVSQFSHSVVSDSLWTHGLQHARSPCPLPTSTLLRLKSIESVMPSNHLILCRPLLLLPSVFPSIRVFSSEWALHIMWPEYWSLSFSISSSNEYLGLISLGLTGLISLLSKGLSTSYFVGNGNSASSFLRAQVSRKMAALQRGQSDW